MATRLVARPGGADYGVTSVLLQTYADVRIAFGVSRRSFLPRPEVDSAVVDVHWSAAPRVDVGDVGLYRDVVRAAFGQRRKMLRNALAALAVARGTTATAVLERAGIAPTARAETLDLDAFARLARALG
jgi:16S rRNA (adenine1518-N6/adenine1519-N6)-dimethyltransferase